LIWREEFFYFFSFFFWSELSCGQFWKPLRRIEREEGDLKKWKLWYVLLLLLLGVFFFFLST
jgi:hypothetical protein